MWHKHLMTTNNLIAPPVTELTSYDHVTKMLDHNIGDKQAYLAINHYIQVGLTKFS